MSTKGTYWTDFIGELASFEIDSNQIEEQPGQFNVSNRLRASKYSPFANPSYESILSSLGHKALAELQILPENQRLGALPLLERHKQNIEEASEVWRKYYDKPIKIWGADKLITELVRHFSINANHIVWLPAQMPWHDQTELLEDLRNALTRRYQVTYWLINELKSLSNWAPNLSQANTSNSIGMIETKLPTSLQRLKILPEIRSNLYEILSPYFIDEDQEDLRQVLNGEKDGERMLLFKEAGKKLAYLFKELFNNNCFVGYPKKNIQQWVLRNFEYNARKGRNRFTESYLDKIISGSEPVSNPICFVKLVDGKVKIDPAKRSSKKYSNI